MSERGYSLVELLVVLAILTLVTTVTGVYVRGGKPLSLRLAALDLAACLRTARSAAMAQQQERVVVIDLERRGYSCPGRAGFFPAETRLLVRTAASELVREQTAAMRFFADGGATGGQVFMEDHGQIWAVRVNWLSGSVEAGREISWPEH